MPASLKLQAKYGDDIQVVFVESQGATVDQAEGAALKYKFLGGRAAWTSEQPFETGSNTLPNFALLGNDGKVLIKGNPLDCPKEIERLIDEQIKLRKAAPADTHAAVKPAWSEYSKGHYAKALDMLKTKALEKGIKQDATDALSAAEAEFRKRAGKDIGRVAWMISNGFTEEAAARAEELKANVKGDAELEKQLTEAASKLDAPEMKAERDAAKALARMQAKFFESGGDPKLATELTKFAERNKALKAGARAEHIAHLPRP